MIPSHIAYHKQQSTLLLQDPRFFMQKKISRSMVNMLVIQAFILGRTTALATQEQVLSSLQNAIPYPQHITRENQQAIDAWLSEVKG